MGRSTQYNYLFENRSPQKVLGMIIPKETLSRRNPDLSHFHIFGSMIYCHATKDSKRRMEPTAERQIFVGYTETPHIYGVYILSLRMTVMRRDVKFDEEKAMRSYLE